MFFKSRRRQSAGISVLWSSVGRACLPECCFTLKSALDFPQRAPIPWDIHAHSSHFIAGLMLASLQGAKGTCLCVVFPEDCQCIRPNFTSP